MRSTDDAIAFEGPTAEYAEKAVPTGEARLNLRAIAARCEVDRDVRISAPDLATCHGAVWAFVYG